MALSKTPAGEPQREMLFLSTTPGLERALRAEAERLGHIRAVEPGGVLLEAARFAYQEANLRLRSASRVLLRIAELNLSKPDELVKALKSVRLEPYLPPQAPLQIEASARNSSLSERRLELAAGEVWRARPAPGPAAPRESHAVCELLLRAEGQRLTVSIDTSGERLNVRGYRQEIGRAPMRENLAAGMLMLAGYQGTEPFWDPMCGSGTMVIEAALIALRKAPGSARGFAFERWPSHDAARWSTLLEKVSREPQAKAPQPIIGTDLNSGALGTTRRNARRAGVFEQLKLERADLRSMPRVEGAPGLVVANLPYGKRLGKPSELPQLYRDLGAALHLAFLGWRFALLVPEGISAEKLLAVRPTETVPVQNGGIRCALLLGTLAAPG